MKSRLLPVLALGLSLAAQAPKSGLDRAQLDPATSPATDFFQYANGGWLKTAVIPPAKSTWGAGNELFERNQAVLKLVLDEAAEAKGAAAGSELQKIHDFYLSGMDKAGLDREGAKPLQPLFTRIAAVKSGEALASELGHLEADGLGSGFSFSVGIDDKDSSRYAAQFNQGGLSLPDRDYYLKDDEASKALREKFLAHMVRTLQLLGDSEAAAKAGAAKVLALETRLAQSSRSRVELRDPEKNYNLMDGATLEKQAPGFAWKTYFQAVGLKDSKGLIVGQPEYFQAFAKASAEVPLEDWRTYLRWRVVSGLSSYLGDAFVEERFGFFGKELTGAKELEPRWKRVQGTLNGGLGEAVGKLYVKKAFSEDSKHRMEVLIQNLMAALKERIEGLDWMSAPTKAKAVEKLAAIMVKVGYPDRWRDYSALEVKAQPYALNVLAGRRFEHHRELAKLGGPIDRNEWGMTPPTVNAYYNPNLNEIVFPAGILQPPFFNPEADDAVNYGAIGMVIGHELTHGFDDQGCQYDAKGNLKNWWTPEDAKAYASRTDLIVKQYDGFEALPGLHVNGKLTLGENIADLGGLKIAYAAWQKSLKGRPAPVLDGLTGEQRFFLGYAQSWRFIAREPLTRMLVTVDPHSPAKFRVNGPLSNLPEFQKAFDCPEGSPMVRPLAERPAIW